MCVVTCPLYRNQETIRADDPTTRAAPVRHELLGTHFSGHGVSSLAGVLMTLGSREIQPLVCGDVVSWHAEPVGVHDAEVVLRLGVLLVSREAEQPDGFAPLPARARKPVSRVTQGSLFTLPRGPFSSCRYHFRHAPAAGPGVCSCSATSARPVAACAAIAGRFVSVARA